MNERQKEFIKFNLTEEQKVLERLKKIYMDAALECGLQIKRLEDRKDLVNIQSIVYQKTYQEAIKAQIETILDNLRTKEYGTIEEYLRDSYENAYIGNMYDLHGQGIPIITPINQRRVAKAAQINPNLKKSIYESMGVDVEKLKEDIRREVSIGIARGKTWKQVGEMIGLQMNSPHKAALSKAMTIARTEGHRVHNIAQQEAMEDAEKEGADIFKQWNSTLDEKTRTTHQQLDGQIVSIKAKFQVDGKEAICPGGFGRPEEDINCRCVMLQRARWALTEEELETLKERAEFFGLDKSKDFEDFKKKYLEAADSVENKEEIKTTKEYAKDIEALLEEAYESHRIKNDLHLVPIEELRKMPGYKSKAYLGNIEGKTAKAIEDTLTDLIQEYDTPLTQVRLCTKDELLILRSAFATTRHNYEVDSAEIILNPVKIGTYDKMVERLAELTKNGYAAGIPEEKVSQYIFTHEFAHTLLNMEQPLNKNRNWAQADYGKIKKARKEINAIYIEYMKEVESLTERQKEAELKAITSFDESAWSMAQQATEELKKVQISRYSLQNADEFVAEAFTADRLGTGNKYTSRVMGVINKNYKR